MAWGDDDRIVPDPPRLWDPDVVLYRPDGTPLKRQIGFRMVQLTTTCPPIYKSSGKPKKKGK